MHDNNNQSMDAESTRRIIAILGIDGLEKRYNMYLLLIRKQAIFYFSFFSLLIIYQFYFMILLFTKWLHALRLSGDIIFYTLLSILVIIPFCILHYNKKFMDLQKDWTLRSYLIENLTIGVGIVLYLFISLITLGWSLSYILPSSRLSTLYILLMTVSIVPIFGLFIVYILLWGKFFITKRFTVEIDRKDLANHLSSSGLDCRYSRYSGLKCGKIKISIVHSRDPWKNRDYWKITIRTITENNAIVAKGIIGKIEEYAKMR